MKKNILNILTTIIIILSICFIFTSCNKKDYVKEDCVYYINAKESSIMGSSLELFLTDESCITLRKDGTASIYFEFSDLIFAAASVYLNVDGMQDFDVREILEWLVDDYIPGLTIDDMETSFELLRKSLGVKLTGVDFTDPEIIALFDELAETDRIPKNIEALKGFGIEYDAKYDIKVLNSKYTGEYTAVYMGEHEDNGEPFILMTIMTDKETNKEQIILRKEFLNVNLIAEK